MKKRLMVSLTVLCVVLNGCSGEEVKPNDKNIVSEQDETIKESELVEERETAKQSEIELPLEFEILTATTGETARYGQFSKSS